MESFTSLPSVLSISLASYWPWCGDRDDDDDDDGDVKNGRVAGSRRECKSDGYDSQGKVMARLGA